MKPPRLLALAALLAAACGLPAADSARRAQTVVLDATGVANLRIQTVLVEPGDFEETVFALGRIEVYPGRRAVVSSRIPGRALQVLVKHDHAIAAGETAVIVESRQFDDPPPAIKLPAPLSGIVSAVHIVPGEPVSPDKILAEIVDLTEVYAVARVPEHLAGKLRRGQPARIVVAAAAGQTYPAELEHLGVTADADAGTVEAAFHVANPGLVLRPGMRAEFSIVVSRRTDVTRIPRTALQGTPAARFVYVKDFDLPHAFVKSPVVVGQTNDRYVEILSGLLPADEVVTQGAYSLAFAGAGTTSLKEALDAAHGHAHAADGSELTPEQKKAASSHPVASAARSAAHDHDHGHDHDDHHGHGGSALFWQIVSGILLVALVVVSVRRRPGASAP